MEQEKKTERYSTPDHYGTGRQLLREKSLFSMTLVLLVVLIASNLLTVSLLLGRSVEDDRRGLENTHTQETQSLRGDEEIGRKELRGQLAGSLAEVQTSDGHQTGVILSEDGYILTTAPSENSLTVHLPDGSVLPAQLVGTDQSCGLAVIKVDAKGLMPMSVGFSGILTAAEEGMLLLGSPLQEQGVLGRTDSIQHGELTIGGQKRRVLYGSYKKGDLLLNDEGKLIAFCVQTASGIIALPMEEAMNLAGELVAFGYLCAPQSPGMEVTMLDEEQRLYWQLPGVVMVSRVKEGGSADLAGIREGDVLLQIEDMSIDGYAGLWQAIAACRGRDAITVRIYRSNEEISIELNIEP